MPMGNGVPRTTVDNDLEIVENHLHPTSCTVGPSGRRRRAGITFTTAANNENVVVGYTAGTVVTYTFKTVLPGGPAAGAVNVKVQGTVDLTVRMLAQAIQGVTDAANIEYGAGTQPHPDISGYYTGNRFSIANVVPLVHLAGSSLMLFENVQDRTTTAYPFTFTSTTTKVLTAFSRIYAHRYTMTGNAAGPPADCVAGAYQTMMPIGFARDFSGNLTNYDSSWLVVEATSSASMIVEADLYYSPDEVTYTMVARGINLSRDTTTQGCQEYPVAMARAPAGAGMYVKMRSNVAATNEWADFKIQRHTYPVGI